MSVVLLVVYDNGSHIPQPPHGMAYLAAALLYAGHTVYVWDAAVGHMPPEDLTRKIDEYEPDAVCLGVIGGYWQHAQAIALGAAVRALMHKPWFVIGGHGPAACPDYYRAAVGADTVVVGEGEVTLPRLLASGQRPPVVRGEPVDPDAYEPLWPAFAIDVYRLQRYPRTRPTDFAMPVLSGRGCPHSCSFCYRMVDGWRPRAVRRIYDEIEMLKRAHGITYVNFDDELLMVSAARTREICEAIGPLGVRWMCNGRLDVMARHPELAEIMRDAGCVFINYGVESMSQDVLDRMGKHLKIEQTIAGVEATLRAGISPGLNVMWGCPGDTPQTLWMLVDFLRTYDDGAQVRTIRPVTPYPGSALFDLAVSEGKLTGPADFYQRHVNSDLATVQWTGLSNADFHRELYAANCSLVDHGCEHVRKDRRAQLRKLYLEGDASWRGWRHT
jgi:anaerobic magnesium-protoporphyrin IX monomethyl ester cyclase